MEDYITISKNILKSKPKTTLEELLNPLIRDTYFVGVKKANKILDKSNIKGKNKELIRSLLNREHIKENEEEAK